MFLGNGKKDRKGALMFAKIRNLKFETRKDYLVGIRISDFKVSDFGFYIFGFTTT